MFHFKTFIIIAIALLVLLLIPHSIAESPQTDVKIITRLKGSSGFLTPALSENNTFVYDSFEFNLYSSSNNTKYRIMVDNITIANSIILTFKEVFYWNTTKSYIELLEVYIGDDYYSLSNIFVFTYSITNRSVLRDDRDLITFTKEELKQFVMELELQSAGKILVGTFVCGFICHHLVKKRKEETIKRIA